VPASLLLPSGRKARLEYDKDQLGPGGAKIGPSLEARPQDIYGLKTHPSILGFPILIKLVSPAGRPIHLTTDIPGFWKGAWQEVRKDLRGRYPKHDWPEDPASASPVAARERSKGGKS
jgi:ATP-dependent helicase HrpB